MNDNGTPHPWGHGHHGNQVVTVPAPTGSIIANVNALGSGCPDGSWDASISDDGQTFTLRREKTPFDPTGGALESPAVKADGAAAEPGS